MGSYYGHINLSSLYRATILRADVDGERLNGLFIPFKYNPIFRLKNAAIIRIFLKEIKKFDIRGYSHNIGLSISKEHRGRLSKYGFKSKKIGALKRYDFSSFQDVDNKINITELLSDERDECFSKLSRDYSFEIQIISDMIKEYDFRENYSEKETEDIIKRLSDFMKEVST